MDKKLIQAFIAGILATTVMSMIMYVAPMMGLPKMNPPAMLAGMMGLPPAVGWLMHFMIGIIFAALYVLLFAPKITIKNKIVKGAVFGLLVFIFAQIAMAMMGALMGGIPQPEGAMIGVILGGILGHLIFGIVVALAAKS